jgi:thiol-disulfide isomerase/thioredoxin
MSNPSSSSSGLGPTGVAFGLGMAMVGLVLGYMIGAGRGGGTSSEDLAAEVDKAVEARLAAADLDANAPGSKVVNKTGGDLRKLSDDEKKELLAKKNRAEPAPAPPADSPFLTDTIKKTFGADSAALQEYSSAVALMAEGNARKARPTLTALYGKADGQPWKEQVEVLLADARVSVGEVNEGREMLTAWRASYPMSAHAALATVAEGKAAMKDAKRISAGADGAITAPQKRGYTDAITLFDKAITGWPGDPALEEAYLNKAALLGELGQMDAAEEAAMKLAADFPSAKNAPRAVFNVARLAFDNEDFPRAERLYNKLVDSFPNDRLSKSARSNLSALELLGKPAPELEITEWVGDDLGSISSMKGKPVLLVFWATWCPHCRKAMPGIEETVWQKYRDQGLQVVAVTKNSRGQTTDTVRSYLSENGYTMPVAIDPGGTSRNYGVSGIPAAALVDKNGKVVFRNHPSQVTDALIQKYL